MKQGDLAVTVTKKMFLFLSILSGFCNIAEVKQGVLAVTLSKADMSCSESSCLVIFILYHLKIFLFLNVAVCLRSSFAPMV